MGSSSYKCLLNVVHYLLKSMENCGPRFTKWCQCTERIIKGDNKTGYFETNLFHATLLLIPLYTIALFFCGTVKACSDYVNKINTLDNCYIHKLFRQEKLRRQYRYSHKKTIDYKCVITFA